MAPAVIYMDDCEKIFIGGGKKKKKKADDGEAGDALDLSHQKSNKTIGKITASDTSKHTIKLHWFAIF